MAQDIVINGVTYPDVESIALTDANGNTVMFYSDAVRYTGQSLTEGQKSMARENIGAVDRSKTVTLRGFDENGNSYSWILYGYQQAGEPV